MVPKLSSTSVSVEAIEHGIYAGVRTLTAWVICGPPVGNQQRITIRATPTRCRRRTRSQLQRHPAEDPVVGRVSNRDGPAWYGRRDHRRPRADPDRVHQALTDRGAGDAQRHPGGRGRRLLTVEPDLAPQLVRSVYLTPRGSDPAWPWRYRPMAMPAAQRTRDDGAVIVDGAGDPAEPQIRKPRLTTRTDVGINGLGENPCRDNEPHVVRWGLQHRQPVEVLNETHELPPGWAIGLHG
jgi:hypothetical protein